MAVPELKWKAPEFEHRVKDVSWYWISIIVALIVLIFVIWQKNFLFAFFVIVAEVLMIVWANRHPAEVEFTLNDKGLVIGGRKLHAYTDLEHFSYVHHEYMQWGEMHFTPRGRLSLPFKVLIGKDISVQTQQYLHAFMTEVEHEDSIWETLEEIIGF